MKKYSEITLSSDERKLLEVLKDNDFTEIKKVKGHILGRRPYNYYYFNWCFWFRWMDDGDEYDIDKLLNPSHEPKTVWELKRPEQYWFINSCGEVIDESWIQSKADLERRNHGNAFLTKEEAEFEVKRREVVAKVSKHARPFKLYWENYYACLNHSTGWIDHRITKEMQYATLFFDSEEDVKKAIAEVGEEDFKKYYLGVAEV